MCKKQKQKHQVSKLTTNYEKKKIKQTRVKKEAPQFHISLKITEPQKYTRKYTT